MPKTGLKTFVYSFSISLLMIFSLDRVLGRAPSPAPQSIEIPSKNIMLFIRSEPADPSSRPVPVKKIALRVLPEIQPLQAEAPAPPEEEGEIIMADSGYEEIPLEISPLAEEKAEKPAESFRLAAKTEPEPAVEKPVVYQPQLVLPAVEEQADKIVLSEPEKVMIPLEKQPAAPGTSVPVSTAAKAAEAPKIEMAADPVPLIPPSPPAQAKMMIAVREENHHERFPLQKNRDELAGLGKNIKIAKSHELNQVALADSTMAIKGMIEDTTAEPQQEEAPAANKWQKMADKPKASDSPWVVAKGAVKPQNSMVAQEIYYQKDNQQIKDALNDTPPESGDNLQLASETVKNLLIPIPEDILNDENLTPQLVSPSRPEDVKKEAELETDIRRQKELEAKKSRPKSDDSTKTAPQKKLLSSLSSIFKDVKEEKAETPAEDSPTDKQEKKAKPSPSHGKILPTEMRLSFQPNRAGISGQTLRWIQAFAAKTATEADMAIEIRIDGTGAMELQQKRLNLLHNILTNKGVEYSKINTVFTTREPNSFIIRTVKLNIMDNFKTGSINGNIRKASDGYYLQW